ncbi:hypothetical protein [Fictibacillus fluitans]|uniref:Uncharacterized protein n=1 Tax=Fictibacillus fluitans TaxID=3058422 RepID=A0ABT8HYM1_9BACL|nr:hypothetical protein [Fictibacillus sp. NE201]MDN4525362.1 hypothetical protein [Fictibacillus sp. NE201]
MKNQPSPEAMKQLMKFMLKTSAPRLAEMKANENKKGGQAV